MSVSKRDETSVKICVTMYCIYLIASFVMCVISENLDSENVS